MTAPTPTADRLAIAATAFDLAAMRVREAAEALDGISGMHSLAAEAARTSAGNIARLAAGLRDEARTLREAADPSATTGGRA